MGCFDFTYADNGRNTRGNMAYFYLTKAFCQETGLKSPLKYENTDEYGMFNTRIQSKLKSYVLTFDIYAFYGAMLHLESLFSDHMAECKEYLNLIHKLVRQYRNTDSEEAVWSAATWTRIEELEDVLRLDGINYFFSKRTKIPRKKYIVPKIGNQKEHDIDVDKVFSGKLPLLISRKRLPTNPNDDVIDIAKNWGYVTDSDPNQGFNITRNHWLPFDPTIADANN